MFKATSPSLRRVLWSLLLMSMLTFFLSLGPSVVRADPSTVTHQTVTFSVALFDVCSDEFVDFTFELFYTIVSDQDAAGGTHFVVNLHSRGSGLGLTSGTQYRVTDAEHFAHQTTNGADEVTQTVNLHAIAQGATDNLTISTVTHITTNANGDVTASVSNTSAAGCHG